jgi:hypothetical protein
VRIHPAPRNCHTPRCAAPAARPVR